MADESTPVRPLAAGPHRPSLAARLGRIAALPVAVLLIWMAVTLIRGTIAYVRGLDSDLSKALLTGGLALFGSVASLAIGKAYEVRAAIRKELREKKAPVYDNIVSTLFSVLFAEKLGREPLTQLELMQFFATTTEKLTIWGADEVLRSFGRFRDGATGSAETMFLFEDLLFAIRKDLGHKNANLARGAILRLFVNDLDDFLRPGT